MDWHENAQGMNPESNWNGLVCPKCSKTYHAKSHLKHCHQASSEGDLRCVHLSARQEAALFRDCRVIAESSVAETAKEVGLELENMPKVVALLKHFGHHISREETSTTTPQAIPSQRDIRTRAEEDPRTSDTNLIQDASQEAARSMTSEKDQEEQLRRTGSTRPTQCCVRARTKINSSDHAVFSSVRSERSVYPDQGPPQTGTSSTNPPGNSKVDEESTKSDQEDLITSDDAVIHTRKNRDFLYKSFPINEPVMQSFTSYLCNIKKLKRKYALKVVARVSRHFCYMQKKVFNEERPSQFTLKVLRHGNESAAYIKELRDAGISSDTVRRYLGALITFVDFLETSPNNMQVKRDLRYFRQSINWMIRKQKLRRNVLPPTQDKWDLSVVRQGYTSSSVKQEVHRIIQTAKNVDLNIWSDSTLGVLVSERSLVMRYVACGIIQLGLFHRACVSKAMTLSDFEGARRVGDKYIIVVHKTSSVLCLNLEEYNLFKDYRNYVRGTQPEDSTPKRSTFFRMPNGQPLLYPLSQCSSFQPLFGIVRDTAKDGARVGYTAVNARNALRSIITDKICRHPDIILILTYLDHCEKCKPLDNEEDILRIRFLLDQITASSLKGSSDDHSFTAVASETCRLQRLFTNSNCVDDRDQVPGSSVSSPLTDSTHSSGDEQNPLSSTLRSESVHKHSNQSEISPDTEDFLESFSPILSSAEEDETQDPSSPVIEYMGAEERDPELFTISTDSSDALEENRNLHTHRVKTASASGPGKPTNMSDSDGHNFEPCTSPWHTSLDNGAETSVASSPLINYMGAEGYISDLFSVSELTDSEDPWSFSRPEDSNDPDKPLTSDSTDTEDGFRNTASPEHTSSPELFRPRPNSGDPEGTAGQRFRSDSVDGDCSGSSAWNLKLDVSSDGDDEEEPSSPSPKKRRWMGNRKAKPSGMIKIARGKQGAASAELPVSVITGLRAKFCDEFPLRPYGPVPSVKEVAAFLGFHGVTGDGVQAVYARNYRAMWRAKQRELVVYLNLMHWPRKPSLEEAKQLLEDLHVKLLPSKVLSLYDDFRRRYQHSHRHQH